MLHSLAIGGLSATVATTASVAAAGPGIPTIAAAASVTVTAPGIGTIAVAASVAATITGGLDASGVLVLFAIPFRRRHRLPHKPL